MGVDGRRGASLVAAGVGLGVAGDVLLDGKPLGVDVFLFALLFVAALAAVLRVSHAPLHQGRRWMAAPLLLFAAAFAWHTSPLLVTANLLALAGAISLGALRRTQPKPQDATLAEYAAGLVSAGAGTFAGTVDLLEREVPWESMRGLGSQRAATVGRGLAIAVPFLALFGTLFLAADAVFRRFAASLVPTHLPSPWPHGVVIVLLAWAAAGLLRDLAAPREEHRLVPAEALVRRRIALHLGGTEVAIALAALDALFLAFVVVQARYLFGGASVVESTAHLTYATYARHGFFELVAVSVLVVPVVLAANGVARDRRQLVRMLALVLVVLELAVAASALQRMHVYVQQYGLTELRIYTTGMMLWICVVLLWAGATVLRGNGRRFAVGAVVAGFVATAALNVIDPDALIARTNLTRSHHDAAYVARLGDDAVPAILEQLPRLRDRTEARTLARGLLARRFDGGLLGWNASRSEAHSLVQQHRAELERLARR